MVKNSMKKKICKIYLENVQVLHPQPSPPPMQLKQKQSLWEPAASLKWCSISICERTFQIFNSQPRTALCSAEQVKMG